MLRAVCLCRVVERCLAEEQPFPFFPFCCAQLEELLSPEAGFLVREGLTLCVEVLECCPWCARPAPPPCLRMVTFSQSLT